MTGLLWGARSYTLSRTRSERVALCGGRAAVSALGIAPSPQPSPQRGEGVGLCNGEALVHVRSTAPSPRPAPRHSSQGGEHVGLCSGWVIVPGRSAAPSPQPSPHWGEGVGLCNGEALVHVRSAAPSPRPAPQPSREGVGLCGVWERLPNHIVRAHAADRTSTGHANHCRTTSLLRPIPLSPRPSGERARVRGNVFQATQESQK